MCDKGVLSLSSREKIKKEDLQITNCIYQRNKTHLLWVTTALSISINFLFVWLYFRQKSIAHREDDGDTAKTICLDCNIFNTSRDVESFSKSPMCCLTLTESIQRIIFLFTLKLLMNERTPGKASPSAHLFLDTLEDNNYKWTDEYGFGSAHVTGSVMFKDGRFQVRKAGYYNVYSLVTLKRRSQSQQSSQVRHSIRRIRTHRNQGVEDLLENSVILPPLAETFRTSQLDGMVLLQAEDQLFVDVTSLNYLYRYAPSNYFGLSFICEI